MMTPASSHFQMATGTNRAGKAKTIAEWPEAASTPANNPATTPSKQATTAAVRRRRDAWVTGRGRIGAKARGGASFSGRVAVMSDDVGVDALVREDHDHGQQRLQVRMAVGATRTQGDHEENHNKEGQPGWVASPVTGPVGGPSGRAGGKPRS